MLRIFTCIIIGSLLMPVCSMGQTFAPGPSLGDLSSDVGAATGIAIGDYDNDGDDDVFISNYSNTTNGLYENDGTGNFILRSESIVSQEESNTVSANWIDYNNDGFLDLYVVNANGINFLYRNEGNGDFTRETTSILENPLSTYNATWADYNNDGILDAYVANIIEGESGHLFAGNGDGTFEEIIGVFESDTMETVMPVWIDYDRDRDMDLFLANMSTRNQLFRNDGDGQFNEILTGALVTDDHPSWSVVVANFDYNQYPDILVTNLVGTSDLYLNNGSTFGKVTTGDIVTYDNRDAIAAAGDLDNDGDVDIVIGHYGAETEIYSNNGGGSFTRSLLGPIESTYGIALWDMDDDGYLDIFKATWDQTLPISFYQNTTSNTNNYLKLKLEGVDHKDILNSFIRISTDTEYDVRSIESSTGWGSQDPHMVHFGLGATSEIYNLYIEWPDGSSNYYYDLELNQTLVLKGMGPSLAPRLDNSIHSKITQGENYEIGAYIENNEPYAAEGFRIDYYISTDTIIDETDFHIDSLEMDPIDENSGRYAFVNPVISEEIPLGNYYLLVYVDSENEIAELNEEDNYLVYPIEVLDYFVPNLSVYTYITRSQYNAGTDIDLQTTEIHNNSDIDVQDVEIAYYLSTDNFLDASDDLIYSEMLSVDAQDEILIDPTLTVPSLQPIGTYRLLTVVDPNDLVEESTETDNIRYSFLYVVDYPVTPTDVSASIISTSQIDLTWTDNSTVETEYLIYRDDVLIATLGPDVEFFSDINVTAGIEYKYNVIASNVSNAAWSSNIYITIDPSTEAEQLVAQISGEIVSDMGNSLGASFGDFDNDGDDDLFIANIGEANFLYQNNGDGTFTKIIDGEIVNSVSASISASWGDYNNDGWIDIYVVNYEEDNQLYHNNGDGTFSEVAATAGVHGGGNMSATWGDYDRDGELDLFVVSDNTGSNNILYKNNGDGTFTSESSPITSSNYNSVSAMWVDVNNDWWMDLFIVNYNEKNQLWINNRDGSFTQWLTGAIVNDVEASWSASWGDSDNNGYLDLYVANKGQQNSLYKNWCCNSYEKVNVGVSGGNANSEGSSWSDYDNDGDLDLFVTNSGENNMLFRNNGDNTFSRLLNGDVVNDGNAISTATAWADVDNNGFTDLFVANASGESNFLYLNDGNANNWTKITLKGVEENTDAIGGRVSLRVSDGGGNISTYFRQVTSNSGTRAQNSFELEFGLGDKDVIEEVFIRWPNGDNMNTTDQVLINSKNIIRGMGIDLEPSLSNSNKTIVKQGDELNVNAWVNNSSQYNAGATQVRYYLSADTIYHSGDILLDSVNVESINAYNSPNVGINKNITGFPLGQYYLLLIADFHDEVTEINEVNNIIYQQLIITDEDLSDLETWVINDRYQYNADTKIDFTARLNNNSEFTVEKTSYEIYFSDDDFISSDDSLIYRNDSLYVDAHNTIDIDTSFHIPAGTEQGYYYILVMADPDSAVFEASENNNFTYMSINVLDRPARPTNLNTTVASLSQINLSWQDNSNNEVNFIVERNGAVIATLDPDVTEYEDHSVTVDEEYVYQIIATNEFGNSGSNTVTGYIAEIPELLIPVASGSIVTDGGSSTAVAWGDYNNDGYVDLFVANTGANNYLYENNGDGTFTKIASGDIVNSAGNSVSASWADYNNDGYLDLFVVNHDQNNFLYRNNGDGTFTNEGSGAGVLQGNTGAAWGDYNQDGWIDLYVTSDQTNILYKNNGDGTFEKMSVTGVTSDINNSIAANWVDIDNDRDIDLFVVNYEEANKLYINDGGSFTSMNTGSIVEDVESSWGASWGDYNNDGYLDLFVANKDGNNSLYKNEFGGSFQKITTSSVSQSGGNSESSSWGDYDNDGDLDLFVANVLEDNMLFQNNGEGTFLRVILGDVVNDGGFLSTASAFADFNNDGFLDLFVANAAGQDNLLYENAGNSNNWIQVKLEGTQRNSAAIDAVVIVANDGSYQYRPIESVSGGKAQNHMVASFGLGADTDIYDIIVDWPDGYSFYYDLNLNERHVIRGMGSDPLAYLDPNMVTRVNPGESFYIEGHIPNWAPYGIDSVDVNYFLSADPLLDGEDELMESITLYDLPANSFSFAGFEYQVPADQELGDYYVLMEVDPEDEIRELSESNNLDTIPITVTDVELIDLIAGFGVEADVFNRGSTFDFRIDIANESTLDVQQVTYSYYLSTDIEIDAGDELLGTDIIDLDAEEEISINASYEVPLDKPYSLYYILIVVDEEDEFVERSEANNYNRINFYVVGFPAYPTSLTAEMPNENEILLNWNDNSTNELEYLVERNGSVISSLAINSTTYADQDVSPENTYSYRVIAKNHSGNSGSSTVEISILAKPTEVEASVVADNEIELSWTDNSNMETAYVIERNGEEYHYSEADLTSYSDTDVEPDTEYTYQMKAINYTGESVYSEAFTRTILAVPTELTGTVISGSEIELTWIDNSNIETEYIVERDGVVVANLNADTNSFMDTGLTADVEYSYRVRAINDSNGESWYSNDILITPVSDNAGPVINLIETVSSYKSGDNSKFIIEVTDPSGLMEVDVLYTSMTNEIIAENITTITLDESGENTYEFMLQDGMFDELGLIVAFVAYDNFGNSTATDDIYIYLEYEEGDAVLNTLNGGETTKDYRMISVPLSLQNSNVPSVFSQINETYDPSVYRIFHFSNGTNIEYGSGWNNIDRGLGYWFLFKGTGNSITLGAGDHSLPNDQLFTINLSSGWNQIGNPYLWNLSWDDILSYNGLTVNDLSELYFYYDGYLVDDIWLPYEGAFVNSPSAISLVIPIIKNEDIQGRKRSENSVHSSGRIQEKSWELGLKLVAGEKENRVAGIGMNIEADNSRDQFDRLTPPRFMDYLEMNFIHPEFHYPYFSRDIVTTQDNYIWEFTVESNTDTENLMIAWDREVATGADKKLVLQDLASDEVLDMSEFDNYSFKNGESRQFRILYGSQEYIDEEISSLTTKILHAYPNPFTDDISLPFILKGSDKQYDVELSIVGINGEILLTLIDQKLASGYHKYSWDGRLANGTELSAGIYIQQLVVKDGYNEEIYRIKLMKK